MFVSDMPLEEQLEHVQRLAERSLGLWDIPEDATVRLLNVSENFTGAECITHAGSALSLQGR